MELFIAKVVLPMGAEPIFNGAIAIDGSTIVEVGPAETLQKRYPNAVQRDFEDTCLMPGLVNAHTHLELTRFPTDYFSDPVSSDETALVPRCKLGFVDWVRGVIEYRRSVVEQTYADSIEDGLEQLLRSGTTCVGEISNLEGENRLLEKSGIRAVLFPEVISYDGDKAWDFFENALGLIEETKGDTIDQERNWLISMGVSPHAPYTVSRSLLKIIEQYAREHFSPVQIHVAESFQEMEFFFDAGGDIAEKLFPYVGWNKFKPPCVRKTPVEYLESIGFLQCEPSLVHCVQVSDADLDRIAAAKAKVVLCPRSNHFFGHGRAPIEAFHKRGIPLALGTDSLASNASLSMWDELRFLKTQVEGQSSIGGRELLEIATLGSAHALGLRHMVGSFEIGKEADLIAVRVKSQELTQENIYDHLIDHTYDSSIETVVVSGRRVFGKLPEAKNMGINPSTVEFESDKSCLGA